ncbi:hypothetical protein JXA32_00690 [Candidatus Sumerlaeota bacterium]|nr:hypothetical protein [Candidatus Sumerlaeota bacterium]
MCKDNQAGINRQGTTEAGSYELDILIKQLKLIYQLSDFLRTCRFSTSQLSPFIIHLAAVSATDGRAVIPDRLQRLSISVLYDTTFKGGRQPPLAGLLRSNAPMCIMI